MTPTPHDGADAQPLGKWAAILAEVDAGGIAWVTLNRPEKRNAMNPSLNDEMLDVLDAVEAEERARVLVLTGAGESFSAGMDLKEYFREIDAKGLWPGSGRAAPPTSGSTGGSCSSRSPPSRWSTDGALAVRSPPSWLATWL